MQFRKKPVVIEAIQFQQPTSVGEAPAWLTEAVTRGDFLVVDGAAHITTLEGIMTAQPGDWIIRGVKGEIYPCKPDVFAATYDQVAPSTSDTVIEQEIVAKGKTAPRVTLADLEANIHHIETVKHVTQSGQVLRWSVLITHSGFAVVGKPSVAVSPENDDAEIGEQVAFENSRNELWPLMGYALKQQLHRRAVFDASPKVGTGPGLAVETNTYVDGTTAAGVAPLPDTSPAEQECLQQHADMVRESGWAPGTELPPHQKRVIDEKRELDQRMEKLEAFLETVAFAQLDDSEQGRLHAQHAAMVDYSRVLGDRIEAFTASLVAA